MDSKKFLVKSTGNGMEDALAGTEALGCSKGLTGKEKIRLRLISEELFGMMKSIAGEVEADYLVKSDGKHFVISLSSEIKMTQEIKKKLISVSSEGKNAAAKGFMGKIRDMIATALLPDESGISGMAGLTMGFMSMGSFSSPESQQATAQAFMWSMNKYKSEVVKNRLDGDSSGDEWDELEKSIIASIADEITVRISGSRVEIVIDKTF